MNKKRLLTALSISLTLFTTGLMVGCGTAKASADEQPNLNYVGSTSCSRWTTISTFTDDEHGKMIYVVQDLNGHAVGITCTNK